MLFLLYGVSGRSVIASRSWKMVNLLSGIKLTMRHSISSIKRKDFTRI